MMMNKRNKLFSGISLIAIIALMAAGCSKDKYDTKPSLKFKNISSYDVPLGGLFEIHLEYTDAEGDLSVADSSLIIKRTVARCANGTVDFKYALPPIPESKNSSGDIIIRFENGTQNYLSAGYAPYTPSTCVTGALTDTTTFRFYIRDQAGHVSDTISIDKPVLIRKQ